MVTPIRKIEATEAVLKTASVEVKALTLNGKQVTLSVFRQLQEEVIIDPDTALLRGVPWGKVNYFWGECSPDHLHIVWQQGNELRRSCAYPSARGPAIDSLDTISRSASAAALVMEMLAPNASPSICYVGLQWRFTYTDSKGNKQIKHIPNILLRLNRGALYGPHFDMNLMRERLNQLLEMAEVYEETGAEDLWRLSGQLEIEGNLFRRKWSQTYEQLNRIDQLFIAA